jgi:molecular chaperone DnaK
VERVGGESTLVNRAAEARELEAKIKAEELLPAVEAVLTQGLAEDDERGEIEAAAAAVRAAVESGAANPLKAAVQRLDAATEALAARLVEQAMDAALDRQLAGDPTKPLA